MGAVSTAAVAKAVEILRTDVQEDEQLFGSVLADMARMLWPTKTAAHIASAAGCSERAAEFYLAGQRDWSGDAIVALVTELLKRHQMRNVKVLKRQ